MWIELLRQKLKRHLPPNRYVIHGAVPPPSKVFLIFFGKTSFEPLPQTKLCTSKFFFVSYRRWQSSWGTSHQISESNFPLQSIPPAFLQRSWAVSHHLSWKNRADEHMCKRVTCILKLQLNYTLLVNATDPVCKKYPKL